ncbi:MAG: hypothetical protein LBR54_00050, partial [Oscillospiraceae bacterium]|nr:hypothetical protein [Oscillospiraceae bacterium]
MKRKFTKMIAMMLSLVFLLTAVSFPLMLSAAGLTVIHDGLGEVFYDNWSTFPAKANGNIAYCLESAKANRQDGTYSGRYLEASQNVLLFKSAYYLYGGPGWEEFQGTFYSYFPDASKAPGYTHAVLAYIWSGDTYGLRTVSILNVQQLLLDIDRMPMPSAGFRVFVYGEGSTVFQAYLGWEYAPPVYEPIELLKTSNYGTVEGFDFHITKSDGTEIGVFTSGKSGRVHVPDLVAGQYKIEEINLSEDYVKPGSVEITVVEGGTNAFEFSNIKKMGIIRIQKTDANPAMGGYSLAGAVFDVKDSEGKIVAELTTNADGKAETGALPLGTYTIKEKTAPKGFVRNQNTYTVVLSGNLGESNIVYAPIVTIEEQPQVGRIKVLKSNANPTLGDYDLSGALFDIIGDSGLVETIRTDSKGEAQSGDLRLGDYTVVEKSAPYGYILNSKQFEISLFYGGQETEVVYETVGVPEEPQPGIIRVQKNDANPAMSIYPLDGAVFEVKAAETIRQLNGEIIYSKDETVDIITTDALGKAQTKKLPLGSYTVQEITSPYGYAINGEIFDVLLSYAGQEETVTYGDAEIPNEPITGKIRIEDKTGEVLIGSSAETVSEKKLFGNDSITYERVVPKYGVRALSGAEFEVRVREEFKTNDGKVWPADMVVDTLLTDSNGEAESIELPIDQKYYIVETVTPYGMVADPTERDVKLEHESQNIPVVIERESIFNKRQKVELTVDKIFEHMSDDENHNYKPYEYVVFGLYARNDIYDFDGSLAISKDALIERVRFERNGEHAEFKTDLPFGKYYLKEIEWSKSYHPISEESELDFEWTGNLGIAREYINKTFTNIPVTPGNLRIEKKIPKIFEHSTGAGPADAGYKMSDLGFTKGQTWEEYTPIKIGDIKNGTFKADIIAEKERFKCGIMTAEFNEDGDLTIKFETLSHAYLEQSAALDVVSNTGDFVGKDYGSLPFKSANKNYAGATSGSITVSAEDLSARGININNGNQEFYVYLRLDRVVGVYTHEDRSWLDAEFEYEFMVFDLEDFKDSANKWKVPYKDQKAVQNAVKTDVNGILANGIFPIAHPFCKAWDYVLVDLPVGKYLVAEIFRDKNGNIIDNPDFVTVNGSVGNVYTISLDRTNTVEVVNEFNELYDEIYGEKTTPEDPPTDPPITTTPEVTTTPPPTTTEVTTTVEETTTVPQTTTVEETTTAPQTATAEKTTTAPQETASEPPATTEKEPEDEFIDIVNDYVLFSMNTENSINGISASGWKFTVNGNTHSNTNFAAMNIGELTVTGLCNTVGSADFGFWHNVQSQIVDTIELPYLLSRIRDRLAGNQINPIGGQV